MLRILFMTLVSISMAAPAMAKAKSKQKRRPKVVHDTVDFRTAYDNRRIAKRKRLSKHIDIKITPPSAGSDILTVEVYNNSSHTLGVVEFEVEIDDNGWDKISIPVKVGKITPNYSGVHKVKISRKLNLDRRRAKARIRNLYAYNTDAVLVRLDVYSDLIISAKR